MFNLKIILKHKVITGLVVIAAVGGGYWWYEKSVSTGTETKYVLAAAKIGTIVSSVSGSGQVSVSSQVDVKSKVSGDAVYVGIKNGQIVKAGTILVKIDDADAQKTVRDAETNLETAQLSFEKLKQPADELSITQSENSLAQAKESKQNYETALVKAYDDGFNTVSNAFLDLPGVMTGLQDILYGTTLSNGVQSNLSYYSDTVLKYDTRVLQYKEATAASYQAARKSYDANFQDYKSASRLSDKSVIEALINKTYDMTKNMAGAVKDTSVLIQFYEDRLVEHSLRPSALADAQLSSLNTYTSKTNNHLLNLLNIKNSIENAKQNIVNAERSIDEKTQSLAELKAGADALDIRSQELSVKQRENALLDAKEKLAYYSVRAPFDGIIAKTSIKAGDPISGGTVIATLITQQQTAEISLNEVDVAKVKTGQKVILSFDAFPDLSMSGRVAEVDTIGTVSQGVVYYTVKIAMDTQNAGIKPGMSVTANIITDVKTDVVMVPNSAVKSQGNAYYVEVPSSADAGIGASTSSAGVILSQTPQKRTVETGVSNDESTEIISGLKEGEVIVENTITSSQTTATATQGGGFRIPGLGGGR